MRFSLTRPPARTLRRALRKEWLLTNGLGDHARAAFCVAIRAIPRAAHGQHAAGTACAASAPEESVMGGGKEFFSTCQHPVKPSIRTGTNIWKVSA